MKSTRTKTGPKPITYIPAQFRDIKGIDQVTTVRQLEYLDAYLATPAAQRPPCLRLGASVPQYSETENRVPSVTYAVMIDGEVSVIKRYQDPRAAHRWFHNTRRPWNISARFAPTGGGA